jgi:hypothetical protein
MRSEEDEEEKYNETYGSKYYNKDYFINIVNNEDRELENSPINI